MLYVDTSAMAKLLIREPETDALRAFLLSREELLLTSRVGVIELRRIGRRIEDGADRADALAASLIVAEVDETVERHALAVDPGIRSLDAIHLATAAAAGGAVAAFVCYDARLGAAARSLGLEVLAPA